MLLGEYFCGRLRKRGDFMAEARYVRLTFTGGQKNGFGGAVWNVKVFGGIEEALPQQWLGLTAADWDGREWRNNEGMLGGAFVLKEGAARTCRIEGRDALMLVGPRPP